MWSVSIDIPEVRISLTTQWTQWTCRKLSPLWPALPYSQVILEWNSKSAGRQSKHLHVFGYKQFHFCCCRLKNAKIKCCLGVAQVKKDQGFQQNRNKSKSSLLSRCLPYISISFQVLLMNWAYHSLEEVLRIMFTSFVLQKGSNTRYYFVCYFYKIVQCCL